MNSIRFFICHDLNLAEEGQLEVQLFRQLCQRLQENGDEAVVYPGRASEEAFLTFTYKELPTCHWFLIFQTPDLVQVSEIHIAVDIARMRVTQRQMQGLLRFVVQPDEFLELAPEWASIPTFGATSDHSRDLEKLLLAIALNGESTEKEDLIAPPPPPTFTPPQGALAPAALNSRASQISYDDLYSTSYPPSVPRFSWQKARHQATAAPNSQTPLYEMLADRPPELPTRLARLKAAVPLTPRTLLVALALGILLVATLGTLTPLRALIVGNASTLSPTPAISSSSSPTIQATGKATLPPRTVQPILIPTKGPTPTARPTPPTPTPVPTPTPTPKPCPPTILYGGSGDYGSTGTWVKTLQSKLNSLGITDSNGHKLDVDGEFGPLTESAVKKYQTQQHITANGIVGDETWRHLGYC